MRRMVLVLLSLVLLFCGGCREHKIGGAAEPLPASSPLPAGETLTVAVATDLHFLAPALTDKGKPFQDMLARGDGKVTEYAAPLVDAFLSQVLEEQPDVLILSGDLTFNGERESHTVLAEKLRPLAEAGIVVLALPGNHDLNSRSAYRFAGETAYGVESMTAEEFNACYGGLARREPLSRDTGTCGVLYALREDLWVLLVDANAQAEPGMLDDDTLAWVKECLELAREEGAEVLSVTHQNLMEHSELFSAGFTLGRAGELEALYRTYGVNLNLSGHMHIQHIASTMDGALWDIATSALAVSPNQYGILEWDGGGTVSYCTEAVDVSAWAAARGETDPELLNFADYARDYFDNTSRCKAEDALRGLRLTAGEREEMLAFAGEVNRRYFAGTLWEAADRLLASPGYGLWQEKVGESFFARYLLTTFDGQDRDQNQLNFMPG